ncbi:MAG: hypothetical protein M0T84_16700 [Betaproteobacteria bacterium]|nr:hypothetical protein [Betaproteobacteria bacterium]
MAADELFEKMDALLRKHHPQPARPATDFPEMPPTPQGFDPDGELPTMSAIPTLTDIVRPLDVDYPFPERPAPAEPPTHPAPTPWGLGPATPPAIEDASPINDSATEVLLRAVDKHLEKCLQTVIAPRLAQSLDAALSAMIEQFRIHIEHIVRETVASELRRYRQDPTDDPEKSAE